MQIECRLRLSRPAAAGFKTPRDTSQSNRRPRQPRSNRFGSGRGGVRVISKPPRIELIPIKTVHRRRPDRHLGPISDHFSADTIRISQNFRFRKHIPAIMASNRFRNRSGWQFRLCTWIDRFPKLPHNQHPAGSHSKSRAGLFASSKNRRGATMSCMSNNCTAGAT